MLLALLVLAASASATAGGGPFGHPLLRGHTRLDAIAVAAGELSSNWAGYAVTSPDPTASFTKVVGSWKQAPAKCGENDSNSASAFWVGLGGDNQDSQALEQIGTDSDCNPFGPPTYYGWYELVPGPPLSFALTIKPGDLMTASVTVSGKMETLTLKNVTEGKLASVRVKDDAPDLSSAEWIVEAPSMCDGQTCDMVPLANFGSIGFSKIQATANGHTGTLGDAAWTTTPIQLVTNGVQNFWGGLDTGYVSYYSKAGTCLPKGPAGNDGSFTVSWVPASQPNC
jgi:hypothetical protein